MKTFLFEQYGYYPKQIENNSFVIDGWMFKLIPTDLNSENIKMIESYVQNLNASFNHIGPYIIKNKFNEYLSLLNNTNYVLISIYTINMNFEDLVKFHLLFYKKDEYVELDKILEIWEERVDNLEKKLSSYLRVDSIFYKHNLDVSMFVIGLAINAMQYLSDIIYNYSKKMYGVSVVHKRLKNLNSFDFFNPFNFIVEHPLKDIVMLYQNDYISFEELETLISQYSLDIISATFLMARILYRVDIFDAIEEKKDLEQTNQKIGFNLEKEMYKTKKVYNFLKNNYSIRPIDWLEESS